MCIRDSNYIRPDEGQKAQSRVKENGRHSFIDKVKVRLVDSDYWGEGVNFGNKHLHVPNHFVKEYERLLMGGIWAQVDLRFEYDEEGKGKNPFWIERLTPFQIATFDLDEYRRLRRGFTTDEWIDLVLRSLGYEPAEMTRRLKLLISPPPRPALRAQLQPRGTGAARHRQELRRPGDLPLRGPPDRLAHGGDPLRLRHR